MFQANYQYTPLKEYAAMRTTTTATSPSNGTIETTLTNGYRSNYNGLIFVETTTTTKSLENSFELFQRDENNQIVVFSLPTSEFLSLVCI